MGLNFKRTPPKAGNQTSNGAYDFTGLLNPAQAFAHPADVIGDPDLTSNEKRTILASWASDARAAETAPALRNPPGTGRVVPLDEILDALRRLDPEGNGRPRPHYRKVLDQRIPGIFGRDDGPDGDHGQALN